MIGAHYIAPVALTLSGGVWIVMGVFAFGFVALIFSYFTDRGTEIRFHPWGDSRGDAPGSIGVGNVGKDRTVDVRTWTRGTSASRRRNARPARESTLPKGDPELLAQLADWRQRLASDYAALSVPPDPSRDHMLGAPDARLQLVEYADFECSSCQAASLAIARLRKHLGAIVPCLAKRRVAVTDVNGVVAVGRNKRESAAARDDEIVLLYRQPPDRCGKQRDPAVRSALASLAALQQRAMHIAMGGLPVGGRFVVEERVQRRLRPEVRDRREGALRPA